MPTRPVPASWFFGVAAAVLAAATSAATAQPLIITGQTRELRGQGEWTDAGGNTNNTGPQVVTASIGDYSLWFGQLNLSGFITGTAVQTGGFDWIDTISLDSVSFSLGGGNGPGTSAAASMELEFTYTFDIPAPVTYTTSATFSAAPPSTIPDTGAEFSGVYTLTGPSGEVFRYETGPDNGYSVTVSGASGTLPVGSYTLSLVLDGSVSFIAPVGGAGNGAGGGAGGPSPLMTFRVEVGGGPACPADWNDDGLVNSGDITAFLTDWLASIQHGTLVADFNGDGLVNSGDITAFLSAWLDSVGGC